MSGIKPKARESEAGLNHETSGTVEPDAQGGEQGIVLDDKAQEQPKDRKRAQQDSTQTGKPKN